MAEYTWFEFRVFFPLGWLPNQDLKSQFVQLFTHIWVIICWFIHFYKPLEWTEAQKDSSWIWTRVTDIISYVNNHYSKWLFNFVKIMQVFYKLKIIFLALSCRYSSGIDESYYYYEDFYQKISDMKTRYRYWFNWGWGIISTIHPKNTLLMYLWRYRINLAFYI